MPIKPSDDLKVRAAREIAELLEHIAKKAKEIDHLPHVAAAIQELVDDIRSECGEAV